MKSIDKIKKLNIKQMAVKEIYAKNPFVKNKELSETVGVGVSTIREWLGTPYIIDAIYDRFMEVYGLRMPKVLMAQIREAEEGNTQAATLVLKMWDRFHDNLTIKIEAPRDTFKKHLAGIGINDVEEAEILKDDVIRIGESADLAGYVKSLPDNILPPRNAENDSPRAVKRKQTAQLNKTYKRQKVNSQQMERHYWRKRAKAVGVDPLPPGRPSKEKLRKWQGSIIEAEKIFANGILPNKQKSPK